MLKTLEELLKTPPIPKKIESIQQSRNFKKLLVNALKARDEKKKKDLVAQLNIYYEE